MLPALCCRLLDPQLSTSYPSAILARERAIVVNLEFVKAIIAMGECGIPCLLLARTWVARGWLSSSAHAAVQPHAVQPHAVVATTIESRALCPADNIYITNLEDQNTVAFVEELQVRLRLCGREGVRVPTMRRGVWLAVPAQSHSRAPAGGIVLSNSSAGLLTSDRLHPPPLSYPAATAAPGGQRGSGGRRRPLSHVPVPEPGLLGHGRRRQLGQPGGAGPRWRAAVQHPGRA